MTEQMDLVEFKDFGYLQEVNRQFFHPLGLSLSVGISKDQKESKLYCVWDGRDNETGFVLPGGLIDQDKAARVQAEQEKRHGMRMQAIGFVVQPVAEDADDG